MTAASALRVQVTRQVAHWCAAARAMQVPEDFAPLSAWAGLERQLGIALRAQIRESTGNLVRDARALEGQLAAARTDEDLERVRRDVVAFRLRFIRTEKHVDHYGDAVSTRTSPRLAALLGACDVLATAAMRRALGPIGLAAPPVICHVEPGAGAAIMRSGQSLWDGTRSTVATIMMARHNLPPGTALIHEAGHEVASLAGFNEELAGVLRDELAPSAPDLGEAWAGWASEIAADAFAFVHCGYGSVAALHDVVAGDAATVFRHDPLDPHPIAYLRVLLGVAMCSHFYGPGPWDDLGAAWSRAHPLREGPAGRLVARSIPLLPRAVELVVARRMRAWRGRSLADLVDPARVSPAALGALERQAGTALYTSSHWLRAEPLRLLALSSLRLAVEPERSAEIAALQEGWMTRLGGGAYGAAAAA